MKLSEISDIQNKALRRQGWNEGLYTRFIAGGWRLFKNGMPEPGWDQEAAQTIQSNMNDWEWTHPDKAHVSWYTKDKSVPSPQVKQKENHNMIDTLKNTALSLREKIRPYDKYIIMVAVVLAVDYFVFDGKLSDKTKEIFKKLTNKLTASLDKVIDKLGE